MGIWGRAILAAGVAAGVSCIEDPANGGCRGPFSAQAWNYWAMHGWKMTFAALAALRQGKGGPAA
jgi:hypothetical protein